MLYLIKLIRNLNILTQSIKIEKNTSFISIKIKDKPTIFEVRSK